MPTITFNLHGQPSDSIENSNSSLTYTDRYQNTITNGVISNNKCIDRVEVNPEGGEYFENPVTKSVNLDGVPEWIIDVTDTLNLVVDVYYKNTLNITYVYNGGTPSDVINLNPTTSVTAGYTWTTYIQNVATANNYSIKSIKIEVGGVDVTSTTVLSSGGNKGWLFIAQYIKVLDDIVCTINIETNPTTTYNLIGCDYPPSSVQIKKWGYVPVSASDKKIIAQQGYDLHDSIVSITMGGVDITSDIWTNPSVGTTEVAIDIPPLSGNLSMSIQAVDTGLRYITYNLTDCTSTNTTTSLDEGDSYSTTLQIDVNYHFVSVEVKMGGVDITSQVYDSTTHTISIASVTGNIVITAYASLDEYSITYNLINCSSTNTAQIMTYGSLYTTTLQKNVGFEFTYIKITRGGIDVTADYYNAESNYISIPVTADIVITATASQGVLAMNLYQNDAEFNRVDKDNFLTSVGTITGTFKDVTSVTTPSIIIERNTIDFNYIYINLLNRYYFVDEVISVKHNLWQVKLKVDVLMTYKGVITGQTAYVSRNENTYDEYMVDAEIPVTNEPNITIEETTTIFSTSETDTVLLNYYR